MESKKRICVACGKGYHYCPNCAKDAKKPTWMFILCSDTCHEVFEILNKRGFKEITDDEAKEALLKLGIAGMEFEANTQRQIDGLFKTSETELKTNATEMTEPTVIINTVLDVEEIETSAVPESMEVTTNREKSSNAKKNRSFSKRAKIVN